MLEESPSIASGCDCRDRCPNSASIKASRVRAAALRSKPSIFENASSMGSRSGEE
jgi:hypothetical protein